jgi:hypothetical protein
MILLLLLLARLIALRMVSFLDAPYNQFGLTTPLM